MNRYSIEDQIERFGLSREDAEEKIKQIKNNIHKWNIYSIDDQMSKFGLSKEEAEEKIKQIKNVNVFSIEWQINKFGLSKEEAIEKIENIKNKLKESQSKMSEFDFNSMIPSKKEHWVKKGYSEEESNLKSNLNIKTATNNCNSFVEDKKLNPNKYIGIFNTSIDYYLKKGYSVEESKKLLKYANKEGWAHKTENNYKSHKLITFNNVKLKAEMTVKIKTGDYDAYPYMDTFARNDRKLGILYNDNYKYDASEKSYRGCYILNNTDGGRCQV